MKPPITSLTNPRIKELVRLQTRPAARRESGLFCVESARELERAIARGFEVAELYVCREMLRNDLGLVATDEVSEAVLRKIAYRENPEGFVAVLRTRTARLEDLPRGGRELFVLCGGVEKPGNIGAILRSADAAGATAVLIDVPAFDVFNPNCIRASTGAVFSVPVVCEGRDILRRGLRERGVRIIAATPEATTVYTEADLRGPVALAMGAEAEGLDEYWRSAAETAVSIPQRGAVDSLNVSVTTALLLFEAVRQRGGSDGVGK